MSMNHAISEIGSRKKTLKAFPVRMKKTAIAEMMSPKATGRIP